MAVAISLFACTTPQANRTNDAEAANLATFKENAKVVEACFKAFAKNDFAEYSTYVSDSAKFYGPGFNDTVALNKTQWIERLASFHTILKDVNAGIVGSYPGLDSITYKPDGAVRSYVMWSSESKINGKKYNNKFYGVYKLNADHKIVDANEFLDATGIVADAIAPKK